MFFFLLKFSSQMKKLIQFVIWTILVFWNFFKHQGDFRRDRKVNSPPTETWKIDALNFLVVWSVMKIPICCFYSKIQQTGVSFQFYLWGKVKVATSLIVPIKSIPFERNFVKNSKWIVSSIHYHNLGLLWPQGVTLMILVKKLIFTNKYDFFKLSEY